MMSPPVETDIKQQVRHFYDQVGWQEISAGVYQNARYEDLRPVSSEYIHRCHLRVARHLDQAGKYLLDAGSGPIQYPEYLEYSHGYEARVCADISIIALQEARRRIGDRQEGGHGLFIVADVANLPFKPESFDGLVSLHTLHHLPATEQRQAYLELYRVLALGKNGIVVNGWDNPIITRILTIPIHWAIDLKKIIWRVLGRSPTPAKPKSNRKKQALVERKGTFVSKNNADWLKREVRSILPLEILVWRSVSVKFLRTFVHARLGGRWFLRLLFWLEERFPHFFGENGQYPLIVIKKTGGLNDG